MTSDTEVRHQRTARILLALLLAGAGIWTLHRFIPALIWASILAIAVWPSYARILRRWPPSGHHILWPMVFTLGVALIFATPLTLFGIQAVHELHTLYGALDQLRTDGIPPPAWLSHLPFGAEAVTQWWRENLATPDAALALLKRTPTSNLVSNGGEIGSQVAHRAMLFGFMLVTLFFLFRHGAQVIEQMRRASTRAFGPAGERIGRQIIASVHGTVDGLVLVGLGEGLIMGIAYVIAGVPHPTLFGMFTAVAAMVPFGIAIAFGAAALVLVFKGAMAGAAAIAVLGCVVTFVADHFIRPSLIGNSTRLPFLWVLLGILGGVETWGLIGLFLGPAIMAALILLWREWIGAGQNDAGHDGAV